MNLIALYKLCEDNEQLLKQLQNWGLIPRQGTYKCGKCNGVLALYRDKSRIDGWRWVCNNKVKPNKKKAVKCTNLYEFRKGTFFGGSKLSIFQILGFVHCWVENVASKFACMQLQMSEQTAVDWSSYCREVLLHAFINHGQKLGGVGKIVEIDESKFGKRKYNKGHYVESQWLFGGYERGTGRVFMVTVDDRTTATLLPIIEKWIEKGTTIISDCWKAYDCLKQNGYDHLTVNHSENYKDPVTGAHTNAIESSWRHAKAVLFSNGRIKAHIPGNLARYMFYKRWAEQNLDRTEEFFRLAGKL